MRKCSWKDSVSSVSDTFPHLDIAKLPSRVTILAGTGREKTWSAACGCNALPMAVAVDTTLGCLAWWESMAWKLLLPLLSSVSHRQDCLELVEGKCARCSRVRQGKARQGKAKITSGPF